MNPAWSVIFLTTLTGAGQGLFLALYGVEISAGSGLAPPAPVQFYTAGSVVSIVLLIAGLGASFLHLGHPERAWRAAAMWRTSWLSREVIVLPAFIALVALWWWAHRVGWATRALPPKKSATSCLPQQRHCRSCSGRWSWTRSPRSMTPTMYRA